MGASTISDRVQALLDWSGAEAKYLSLAAGLSQSHVGQIARGTVEDPSGKTVAAIADVAGVSPAWLAFGLGPVVTELAEAPEEEVRQHVATRVAARVALVKPARPVHGASDDSAAPHPSHAPEAA